MKNVSNLASKFTFSPFYRLVNSNITNIKWFMYGLVVCLNLNVLMSSERLRSPWNLAMSGNVDEDIKGSLIITWILGVINFFGYFIIVGFLGLTEIPLLIRQTRAKAKAAQDVDDWNEIFDWSAFKLSGISFFFVLLFICMHSSNFETNPSLYWVMVVISLIWFSKNFRDFVKLPVSPPLQIFIIVYDLFVTKPFLRNHLVLQLFSIFGFQDNQYFTLMLFDIFNNSPMLQDMIRSFTVP